MPRRGRVLTLVHPRAQIPPRHNRKARHGPHSRVQPRGRSGQQQPVSRAPTVRHCAVSTVIELSTVPMPCHAMRHEGWTIESAGSRRGAHALVRRSKVCRSAASAHVYTERCMWHSMPCMLYHRASRASQIGAGVLKAARCMLSMRVAWCMLHGMLSDVHRTLHDGAASVDLL